MKRWLVLCLFAGACGSESNNPPPDAGPLSGTGTISGTVNGQGLSVKDAVFGLDGPLMTLVVSDRSNVCTLLGGSTLPAGQTTVLGIALLNYVGGVTQAGPIVTGNYNWYDLPGLLTGSVPVPPVGTYWNGAFAIPTSCDTAIASFSISGNVEVTQVGTASGTHLKANLSNLAFDGGTLNGTVDAIYCVNAKLSPNCGGTGLLARPAVSE